uniref:ARAD1C28358p n=1 Tax=Blastobotrys adeninivorans TaxID=409370 RepID=A0A060T215_BLAAD
MDFLARTLGSFTGPSIPFNIGELVEGVNASIWSVHDGTAKSNGAPCTVFMFDTKGQGQRAVLAKNMLQKLRRLRLPGVLRIVDSFESETSIIIATERVRPLSSVLNDLSDDAKLWGLRSIMATVSTLSKQAGCIHGNINPDSSIFVNEAGEWVLGGFELAYQVGQDDSSIYSYASLVPGLGEYTPPETQKSGWGSQSSASTGATIDSWQVGTFIYDVFNGLHSSNRTGRGKIPSVAVWNIQKQLSASVPRQRVSVEKALESPAFTTPMTQISEQLSSLPIASDGQLMEFLRLADANASKMPPAFVHNKIVPQLVECLTRRLSGRPSSQPPSRPATPSAASAAPADTFVDPTVSVKCLTSVIQLAKSMDSAQFAKVVAPLIVTTFASPDRAIRLQLLTNITEYIDFLDKKTVSSKIFPLLSTGFHDSEPVIRENSVKSILPLMEKLNDRIINGELLRLLAKAQNDSQPQIRANTTILLGRIAEYFNTSSRASVLTAAFGKALKDSYSQSRIAALMALTATADTFTPPQICEKIIGVIGPTMLDKDASVRKLAHSTMEMFLNKIKTAAAGLGDSGEGATEDTADSKWSLGFVGRSSSAPVDAEANTVTTATTNVSGANGVSLSNPTDTTAPNTFGSITSTSTRPKAESSFMEPAQLANAFDDTPATSGNFYDTAFQDNAFDDDYDDNAWDDFETVEDDNKEVNTSNAQGSSKSLSNAASKLTLEPENDGDDGWDW